MAKQNFSNLTYNRNSLVTLPPQLNSPGDNNSPRTPDSLYGQYIGSEDNWIAWSSSSASGRSSRSTRSPLSHLDLNSSSIMDSDDNSEFDNSPCGKLAITSDGKENAKVANDQAKTNLVKEPEEPSKEDDRNESQENRLVLMQPPQDPKFEIHLPKNMQKPVMSTPLPKKKIEFTPGHSVVSYHKMSSPSKLRGSGAVLLMKNRMLPKSSTPKPATAKKSRFSPLGSAIDSEASSPAFTSKPKDQEWEDEPEHTNYTQFEQSFYNQEQIQAQNRGVFWDPMTPFIVSGHIQNIFNLLVLSSILYFFWVFFQTVRRDVDMKVEEYSTEIMAEMAVCSKEYIQNNCMPGRRVPALEKMCNSWEKCMNRDPAIVGRAKVGAETFGEIFNGFLKPISWKSMFFMVVFVGGTVVLSNVTLSYTRKNLQPSTTSSPQPTVTPTTPAPSQPMTPGTKYYTPRKLLPSTTRRRVRTGFSPRTPHYRYNETPL